MQKSNLLHIAIIQTDIVWENPQANRDILAKKITSLNPKTDLVILPEMFTTGFSMNTDLAETMHGKTISWMQKLAAEKNCAITGSIIIAENENFYNRLIFVYPEGRFTSYDKRHSFTLGNEHLTYSSGNSKLLILFKGWKICPLICYDLRFPVWSRNTAHYELLIYVANWPEKRIYAWDSLLKARAIENLSYTLGVNRVGEDGNKYRYAGHSIALDFLGNPISEENCETEKVIEVVLHKEDQNLQRQQYGFLNDRDAFTIE